MLFTPPPPFTLLFITSDLNVHYFRQIIQNWEECSQPTFKIGFAGTASRAILCVSTHPRKIHSLAYPISTGYLFFQRHSQGSLLVNSCIPVFVSVCSVLICFCFTKVPAATATAARQAYIINIFLKLHAKVSCTSNL